MKKLFAISVIALGIFAFILPKKNKFLGTPVTFITPQGWPTPAYNFDSNRLTKEGIELGRQLFYDGRLAKDGQTSCASCHQQAAAFATEDHNLSHGINNQFTTRNAPSLANLAWQKNFHADGGIIHLDLQPLSPITAVNEMGEDINEVLQNLRNDSIYPSLFKAAFGSNLINTQRLTRVLSQFLLTMVSANSPYDKMKRGEYVFNLPERLGYDIFKQKHCDACHTEPLFTDMQYRNNGLELEPVLKDFGRMRITGLASDSLKFRVPTLRNVAVSFPYMHDGRINSLLDVLEHYNKKIIISTTIDTLLVKKIPLSNYEKGQLLAFLYTLTDSSFLKNPAFGSPPLERVDYGHNRH